MPRDGQEFVGEQPSFDAATDAIHESLVVRECEILQWLHGGADVLVAVCTARCVTHDDISAVASAASHRFRNSSRPRLIRIFTAESEMPSVVAISS